MSAQIDFSRIERVIDIAKMQRSMVTFVGCGGLSTGICDLVRNGLGAANLIDPDVVSESNIARQEHYLDWVGKPKVEAIASQIRRINPNTDVCTFYKDFCLFDDDDLDMIGGTNVFVFGTDSHFAQARGNEIALMLRTPAVFIGLYAGGKAGEIFRWAPGLPSCYRCMVAARYEAFANGFQNITSDEATIQDVHVIDSIALMIIIGQLTRGSDNKYGRLIEQLGDRQLIQMKLDPSWQFNGRDVIREKLGIPA
ncbi:MAG: ThiF family adenylyltransferase, partial [Candidatus Udaeobacter sp.]